MREDRGWVGGTPWPSQDRTPVLLSLGRPQRLRKRLALISLSSPRIHISIHTQLSQRGHQLLPDRQRSQQLLPQRASTTVSVKPLIRPPAFSRARDGNVGSSTARGADIG